MWDTIADTAKSSKNHQYLPCIAEHCWRMVYQHCWSQSSELVQVPFMVWSSLQTDLSWIQIGAQATVVWCVCLYWLY